MVTCVAVGTGHRPFAPRSAAPVIACLVTATLLGAGVPASAWAEPPAPAASAPAPSAEREARAAILPLATDGEINEADREQLTRELVDGLERGNFGIVPPDQVQQALGDARTCDTPKCAAKLTQATQATHLVRAKVTLRDRDYTVEVALVDGPSGQVLARTSEGCEICGIADAGNLVATAAATLRTKLDALARGPSQLAVVSEPADALVSIDGEVVGATPLERPMVPGKHVIRITKEGYISLEREVTLVEGVQESLRFELEKTPSRLPKRPWGWAMLGVGLAGMGTGVAFIALHDRPYDFGGNCTGANVDANGECRYLWDTKWYGMAGVLAGTALATLGVAILLNTSGKKGRRGKGKKAKAKRKHTRVGVGPGSVTVQGRF